MILYEGTYSFSVRVARGKNEGFSDAAQQWDTLSVEERAKLKKRFQALCMGAQLCQEKFVMAANGIGYVKLKYPPFRVYMFREGNVWWVTHIERKPTKLCREIELERAATARTRHREIQNARPSKS